MLFAKKSWPNYLILGLFPICLTIDARRRLELAGFALFSFVAVMEHSYYATLVNIPVRELHQRLFSGQPTCVVFVALEVLLIAGYGWLLSLALHRMTKPMELIPEDGSGATSPDAKTLKEQGRELPCRLSLFTGKSMPKLEYLCHLPGSHGNPLRLHSRSRMHPTKA